MPRHEEGVGLVHCLFYFLSSHKDEAGLFESPFLELLLIALFDNAAPAGDLATTERAVFSLELECDYAVSTEAMLRMKTLT